MIDDLFRLGGKRVLLTGGAQGLGRMMAEALLRAGASVVITSRKADVVAAAAAEMTAFGNCIGIAADLSTPEGAISLVETYRQQISGLDILINNAGKTWGSPLETFPDKGWAGVMSMNVQIPFKMVQLLMPELGASGAEGDPARVINIGSVAGSRVELAGAYSYGASKAAVHHLTRQLAKELASRNITVNAVVPGYFPTLMTAHLREGDTPNRSLDHIPLRRMGRPEDIGGMIVFLSSKASAYVTGAEFPVDGGLVGCH